MVFSTLEISCLLWLRENTRDQRFKRAKGWPLKGWLTPATAHLGAYQVFDAAVNHGIENAVRILQRAVRVADDGNVGPLTLKAVQAMSVTDVLMRFNAKRIRFYTRLSTWSDFGKGWMNRVAGNLDYGADDA